MLFLSAEGPTTVRLAPSGISATPAATGQMQRPGDVRIGQGRLAERNACTHWVVAASLIELPGATGGDDADGSSDRCAGSMRNASAAEAFALVGAPEVQDGRAGNAFAEALAMNMLEVEGQFVRTIWPRLQVRGS